MSLSSLLWDVFDCGPSLAKLPGSRHPLWLPRLGFVRLCAEVAIDSASPPLFISAIASICIQDPGDYGTPLLSRHLLPSWIHIACKHSSKSAPESRGSQTPVYVLVPAWKTYIFPPIHTAAYRTQRFLYNATGQGECLCAHSKQRKAKIHSAPLLLYGT